MNFEFIKSTRFWAVVIGAVAVYFHQEGIITEPLMQLILTICGGHVTIRTVDKFNE